MLISDEKLLERMFVAVRRVNPVTIREKLAVALAVAKPIIAREAREKALEDAAALANSSVKGTFRSEIARWREGAEIADAILALKDA